MTRLDRDPPERDTAFARTGEVSPQDAADLETPLGRSPSAGDTAPPGSIEAEEIRDKSVGQRPSGERTEFHLSGTGAIETDDGLDETGEMVREGAEDVTEDQSMAPADVPVFDRGEHL